MLPLIKDSSSNYNPGFFINELAEASKCLGALEARIDAYQFNSILIPMLHVKEAVSSMYIEGTQTTISEVLENRVNPRAENAEIAIEVDNHTRALIFGADHLRLETFSHSFIQKLHGTMMKGLLPRGLEDTLGNYKKADNRIENSAKTVVYTPPSHAETRKYMDDLIRYMNNSTDKIHPLIKAAIIHSQFESIHPFSDGNGRVGRILVALYLYKTDVINFPFFYISEAISQDKGVYYSMLNKSRSGSFDEWISYFLSKIIVQTKQHIAYIDSLDKLYSETKDTVRKSVNSPKFDDIIEFCFTHPVLDADMLADALVVSHGQALRYLNMLEKEHILLGDDRKRNRTFYFTALLDIARGK